MNSAPTKSAPPAPYTCDGCATPATVQTPARYAIHVLDAGNWRPMLARRDGRAERLAFPTEQQAQDVARCLEAIHDGIVLWVRPVLPTVEERIAALAAQVGLSRDAVLEVALADIEKMVRRSRRETMPAPVDARAS